MVVNGSAKRSRRQQTKRSQSRRNTESVDQWQLTGSICSIRGWKSLPLSRKIKMKPAGWLAASRYNGNSLDLPPVPVISSRGRAVRAGRGWVGVDEYLLWSNLHREKRGCTRFLSLSLSLSLSPSIEVSFFIGRELILRRWKCTFTDRSSSRGKGPASERERERERG